VTLEIEEAARITDGVTILAAEMTAVKSAFYKIQLLQQTTCIKFAVFTDSLNTIALFSAGQCQSRPNLFAELMILLHGIKSQVVLVWIPSHIGILENERADKLAALGAQRETVDVNIGLELQEAYVRVSAYVNSIWQQEWDTNPMSRHFQQICPTVTATWRPKFHSRTTEVLAHRLRLGRCRLNAHLHQLDQSISDNCNFCSQPETIEHY